MLVEQLTYRPSLGRVAIEANLHEIAKLGGPLVRGDLRCILVDDALDLVFRLFDLTEGGRARRKLVRQAAERPDIDFF